jgi:hypothetical protein
VTFLALAMTEPKPTPGKLRACPGSCRRGSGEHGGRPLLAGPSIWESLCCQGVAMRVSNLWECDGGKRGRLAPGGAPGARRKQGVRPYLKSTLQT